MPLPEHLQTRRPVRSRDPELQDTFDDAEATVERRRDPSVTFTSSRKAVEWMLERGKAMQAPNAMHPRTEVVDAYTGERARIAVDGGRGGDLDGLLAVLVTIREAVEKARERYPRGVDALVETLTSRVTQQAIADRHKVTQQALSKEIGKALDVIAEHLRAADVLR